MLDTRANLKYYRNIANNNNNNNNQHNFNNNDNNTQCPGWTCDSFDL